MLKELYLVFCWIICMDNCKWLVVYEWCLKLMHIGCCFWARIWDYLCFVCVLLGLVNDRNKVYSSYCKHYNFSNLVPRKPTNFGHFRPNLVITNPENRPSAHISDQIWSYLVLENRPNYSWNRSVMKPVVGPLKPTEICVDFVVRFWPEAEVLAKNPFRPTHNRPTIRKTTDSKPTNFSPRPTHNRPRGGQFWNSYFWPSYTRPHVGWFCVCPRVFHVYAKSQVGPTDVGGRKSVGSETHFGPIRHFRPGFKGPTLSVGTRS